MSTEILKNVPPNIVFSKAKFKRGESVYTRRDRGNFVHILISGKVICQMDRADGSFMPLCVYEPLSLFGELEIYSSERESAYIEAISDCVTIKINRENFLKWMQQDFDFSFYVMQQLSDKLIDQSKKTTDFIALPVKERVLSVINNYDENNCLDQLSKAKLCYSVSAPLRSVNRAVKSLAKEGLVIYCHGHFSVNSHVQKNKI